jgi:hypothetical protein
MTTTAAVKNSESCGGLRIGCRANEIEVVPGAAFGYAGEKQALASSRVF